ncbi:DUF4268 domain-containing protein [Candidatus Kaiserbacteria bacterium]|nr:DUF4268 domain-containing protein [Candidatus Kaiserbacteria bacterium]
MSNKKLGKLDNVKLRDIWENEERDFSSWLIEPENLALLGGELGIDISFIEKEAGVGKFSLDILAKEANTNRNIIIENQLEITDHDHLGKIITYAAGHNASIVIWIFKDIREEHRQAVDWLNENTNEELSFFAVRVEAWKIDNSAPAPKFHIISRPNEWAKTVRKSSEGGSLGKTKLKQLDFWTNLKSYATGKEVTLFSRTPRSQHWYDVSIGSSEAHISLTVNTRDKIFSCELWINNNKDIFNFLKEQKEKIEKELDTSLVWKDENMIASRIIQRRPNSDLDSEEEMETYYDWFIERTIVFHKVFGKFLNDFKNES